MSTIHRRTGLILAALSTAVMAAALAAPPAAAGQARAAGTPRPGSNSTSWTVTPGGAIAGNSGKVVLKDTSTGSSFSCKSSALTGTLKSGSGLSGKGIGSVTSVTFSNCTGPDGLSFTIQASGTPWPLNATAYNATSGVTTGTITKVSATLSASGCAATLAGKTATTPGQLKITYTNKTHQLRVLLSGGTQHFWDVSGCAGLLTDGDGSSLGVCHLIKPAQDITSPVADHRHGITGIGPPC
jgi:hypothetical protein